MPLLWAKKMRLSIAYTPFKDFNGGDFVLVKLHDLWPCSYLDGNNKM